MNVVIHILKDYLQIINGPRRKRLPSKYLLNLIFSWHYLSGSRDVIHQLVWEHLSITTADVMLVVLLNYTPPPLPALENICYQQIKFVFFGGGGGRGVGFPEKLLEAHRISQISFNKFKSNINKLGMSCVKHSSEQASSPIDGDTRWDISVGGGGGRGSDRDPHTDLWR